MFLSIYYRIFHTNNFLNFHTAESKQSKMFTDESTTNVHAFNVNDTTIAKRFDQSSIADDEVDPELALRQAQFFRFTTNNFLNGIYNIVVESWAEAVNDRTIPMLIQQLNLSVRQIGNKERMEELRRMLLNRLFQHGKLELIFKKAHKFADKYIFYIPPGILETEQPMSAKEIDEDEDKMWKEIAELEEEVYMLRIQLKFVRDENAKAALCQQFLAALELDDQSEDDNNETSANDQGNDEEEMEEEETMMTEENDEL